MDSAPAVEVGAVFAARVERQVEAFACLGTEGPDEMEARRGDDVLRGFRAREEL